MVPPSLLVIQPSFLAFTLRIDVDHSADALEMPSLTALAMIIQTYEDPFRVRVVRNRVTTYAEYTILASGENDIGVEQPGK